MEYKSLLDSIINISHKAGRSILDIYNDKNNAIKDNNTAP